MQQDIHQDHRVDIKDQITPPSMRHIDNLMSVGIQSKSKLCPTKTAPLISSPIKSISCPCAYFRLFISPVVSSNRPNPGLPSQKAWCDVCLSGVLYRSLMLLSAPRPFPMIIQALPLTLPIFTAGSTFCVHPEQN